MAARLGEENKKRTALWLVSLVVVMYVLSVVVIIARG